MNGQWLLENAGAGSRCQIVMSFRQFPRETPVETMTRETTATSQPSALNEAASLAMFYPFARGSPEDCQAWSEKSSAITDQILEAFRSYQPLTVRLGTVTQR
jgi:hypothetical protein